MVPVNTPTKLTSDGGREGSFAGGSALPALGPCWWSFRLRFESEVGHTGALDKTMR